MPIQKIDFTDWTPDQPSIIENLSNAKNVVAASIGYSPFPSSVNYSKIAASETLNSVFAAKYAGTTSVFAAGATRVFRLDSSDYGLDDVSSKISTITNVALTSNVATITTSSAHGYTTGQSVIVDASNNTFDGTYVITGTPTTTTFTYAKVNANITSAAATGTTTGLSYSGVTRWTFCQFGNVIIAANNINKLQAYSGGVFSDLAAAAPIAKYVTVVRDFVVAASLDGGSNFNKVQWSDINDETDWTPGGASQADFQYLPDGGNITGVTGGEFGLIFLERAIVRMTYIGSPLFFQFDTISKTLGCVYDSSITKYGNVSYFLGEDGFYACDGTTVTPIGNQKIDKWFFQNADPSGLSSISAGVDPSRKIVMWNFANIFGGRSLIIYNWQVNKWSYADTTTTAIATIATPGTTLEGLDSAYKINASAMTNGKQYAIVTLGTVNWTSIGATNAVVGARLTRNATAITGSGGEVIDLAAAAAAGFTLDTMTTSLDSALYAGGSFLPGGISGLYIVSFTGSNLTAQIDTGSVGSQVNSVVTLARPLVDGGSANVAVASKTMLNETPSFITYTAADSWNRVSLRSSGKYHQLSVVPTGASWTNAIGVEVEYQEQGTR